MKHLLAIAPHYCLEGRRSDLAKISWTQFPFYFPELSTTFYCMHVKGPEGGPEHNPILKTGNWY